MAERWSGRRFAADPILNLTPSLSIFSDVGAYQCNHKDQVLLPGRLMQPIVPLVMDEGPIKQSVI